MTEYFEDEHTELKRELIDGIKSEIIAFLNSDGGIIYVGVEDDGSIIGINNQAKDNIDLKLGSWIQEAFFPKPSGLIRYYYNEDSEKKNIAEVILAKHRAGSTGTVELLWLGNYTKFANIDKYREG